MEKVVLAEEQRRLLADCRAFVDVINNLSEKQFKQQTNEQWSVADVVQHLYLSARPVTRLMMGPRDVLRQWGAPATESRTYDEIVATYQKILTAGAKAPAAMTPRLEDMDIDKRTIVERFTGVYRALIEAIDNWSAQELDQYVIPHPALGNLTVREMLHFTSAHTQHHLRLLPQS